MKQNVLFFVLCIGLLTLLTADLISYSDGAPESRTGAPGELACNNGYCHNSFPRNSGDGSLRLLTQNDAFRPGETYSLQVAIQDLGMERFGFEILALWDSSHTNAGHFSLDDESGMQIITSGARQYVTHDSAKIASDSASWTLNWTAPADDSGSVTFYVASVAANYNQNSLGDYVYTTTHQLKVDTTAVGIDPMSEALDGVMITYLPAVLRISVSGKTTIARARVNLKLIDLHGNVLFYEPIETLSGRIDAGISTASLPSGIYVVSLEGKGFLSSRKVWVYE